MSPDDRNRLRHIVDAIDSATAFASGRSREDLDRDQMLSFALVRAIEIIGEAEPDNLASVVSHPAAAAVRDRSNKAFSRNWRREPVFTNHPAHTFQRDNVRDRGLSNGRHLLSARGHQRPNTWFSGRAQWHSD